MHKITVHVALSASKDAPCFIEKSQKKITRAISFSPSLQLEHPLKVYGLTFFYCNPKNEMIYLFKLPAFPILILDSCASFKKMLRRAEDTVDCGPVVQRL